MLTQISLPAPPTGTEIRARGRNGWFVPATIWIDPRTSKCSIPEWRGTVEITVNSKHGAETAPIYLSLTASDALRLAEELVKAAKAARG